MSSSHLCTHPYHLWIILTPYLWYLSTFSSSAPCKPENVLVDLQCSTNRASVTWENSGPDQTEVVSAVDSRGVTTTCSSSTSNCTFDQLTCGESYIMSVAGHTNTCISEPAVSERLNTGIDNWAKNNSQRAGQKHKVPALHGFSISWILLHLFVRFSQE